MLANIRNLDGSHFLTSKDKVMDPTSDSLKAKQLDIFRIRLLNSS